MDIGSKALVKMTRVFFSSLRSTLRRTIVLGLSVLGLSTSVLLNASDSSAQTQQWLYGISSTFDVNQMEINSLVRINPVTFEQTVVGPITITGTSQPMIFRGIEFDPNLNRLLIGEQGGKIFQINQDTAVGSSPPVSDQSQFVGTLLGLQSLAYQTAAGPGLPPLQLFASLAPLADVSQAALRLAPNGTDFTHPQPIDYGNFAAFRGGFAWRTSPPMLFADLAQDPSNSVLQEINLANGLPTGSPQTEVDGLGNYITGLAFHPVTNQLFANTYGGALLRIDNIDAPLSDTVELSPAQPSNPNRAVFDLAFVPVTPTPTPTPTITPTFTPTPAPVCPSGLITPCGCDRIEVRLSSGQTLCGPVDTLTKSSIPPAPEVTVRRRSIILVFKNFTAISDGRSFDLIARGGARIAAQFAGGESFSRIADRAAASRGLSLRYEVQITPRGNFRANQRISKLTKRNKLTVNKLRKGTYNVRYRVQILRRGKKVGSTKYSRSKRFRIRR